MAPHSLAKFFFRWHRPLASFLLFLAFSTAGASTAARTLSEIQRSGVIRIGINHDAPPRTFQDRDGTLKGFDIDVGRRLAQSLGVTATFVQTPVAGRLPSLQSGRTDISLGALTRTPEREQLIDFTIPISTDAIGVLTTGRLGISSWRELNDPRYRIVDVRGYASVLVVQRLLPKAQLLLVDNDAQAMRALVEGQADALVEQVEAYVLYTKSYPEVQWRSLKEPMQVGYIAIGVSKGNHELRRALNRHLAGMHRSGYMEYVWKKWYSFPMPGSIDVDAELAKAK
jgi:polar amino acid transport system substrate-binding protein